MKAWSGARFPFVVAAFLMAAALALLCFDPAQAAHDTSATAAFVKGSLILTIPYESTKPADGTLSVELINPEDQILQRTERRVTVGLGRGAWRDELKPPASMDLSDLVWHRIRYRFIAADHGDATISGIESISNILRRPVIRLLGQQSYLAGAPAAVRVVLTDAQNEIVPGASSLRVELTAPDGKPQLLYSGAFNNRGVAQPEFRFPTDAVGRASLRYSVETPIGDAEFTQQIQLESKASILLTTEKPLYQPGQTIHLRALALDRAQHAAVANQALTFEVEDARGNKVFKRTTQTDRFGVAAAEFKLADEVNLGTFRLRAVMETNTSEIAVNVERYVLPKFKVAIELPESARRGYRPGDRVKGTIRANYFFGKPVGSAQIAIKVSGVDVTQFEANSLTGTTDRDGIFHFDLQLPNYFAGRPLTQGAALVQLEAAVKDAAGHSETRTQPITVSASPLLITAIPEGGALAPNLENQVFVLTSYPDGTPAKTQVTVRIDGHADQSLKTDAGGIAIVRLRPGSTSAKVHIEAHDAQGASATTDADLQLRHGDEQIVLRADRAVFRPGDRIQLKVLSTLQRGTAYVDVAKNGQTILTRDVDLTNGQAAITLQATPEMAGALDLNAYVFGRNAQPVADHRLVFVHPADELKVEATTDAPAYKPGDEARVRFRVTNTRGEGVQAALGLQVVDEAVFALAEKRPGFAKVFFYLEQEVLKPRYEIHSAHMHDVAQPADEGDREQRNTAARALFAATELVNTKGFKTEFGRNVPTEKFYTYADRYRTRFFDQVRTHLQNASTTAVYDAWGTPARIERMPWDDRRQYYRGSSAGPDKTFYTSDDLLAELEVRSPRLVAPPLDGPSRINASLEHDHGPSSELAEITGIAADQRGGALEGATVVARHISSGKRRTAVVNANGHFRFSALPAGDYEIQIAEGSTTLARTIRLVPRDRALISAMLRTSGNVRPMVVLRFAARGVVGGVPGGMAGGVIGGIIGSVPSAAPLLLDRRLSMARENVVSDSFTVANAPTTPDTTRVRSYFPEALYIAPQLITDGDGRASISIPIADSITTWRMAWIASTTKGALGSGTSSIKVFQDFFADLDMPVTLTQGDRVSIPVAAYNYSGVKGDVNLKLHAADWFTFIDDVPVKNLPVESDRVGGSQFTIQAKRIGKFKLTLSARLSGEAERADIVVREIEVVPDGREQNVVFNGRLENTAQHEVRFPGNAVPDAGKIFVRLYPGPLSQVIEGMDSILRMPGGCFEQTSSSTYPNVLALDYMKRTKKLTPEVHAKAEAFIANGYQRLLTFEVLGGGFSWFGNAPANKILTAYGLMEFFDMSQVYDVDPKVIARTQDWLASQQRPDGSWTSDTSFINEGATNRFNSDRLRITAYLGWALQTTGYKGAAVGNAKRYVEQKISENADAYTLAVIANFAAAGTDREFTNRSIRLLLARRMEQGEHVSWTTEETAVFATGPSAAVETTGLAVQALLKAGVESATARKALSYVASKKDASGTWGTTQATIMALKALLLSTGNGVADVSGAIEISLNGTPAERLNLTADNNDLFHQFVLKGVNSAGANTVAVRFNGKGSVAYQVVGRYFTPWADQPENEPLTIAMAYDRTRLSQDDVASATVTVRNNLPEVANMVMVDLGIPPGFELLSEDLQDYQEKTAQRTGGRLEKFSLTATQAILYFDSINASQTVTLKYRLRAKYPIRVKTFQARVYEYYDPEVNSVARPVVLEVLKRQ